MKYKLKQGTAKKLREQYYLIMLFWVVIWMLMAALFYADENRQTFLIYLAGSVLLIPFLYIRKIKPYLNNLTDNVSNAYLEFVDNKIIFNHFENLKKFGQEKIEFDIADIVNLKKAFRKDDSVNKVTLTLKNKSKITLEDFENMTDLLEAIFSKSEVIHGQATGSNSE